MKMAFVVCNEFFIVEVMELLRSAEIDYYTRWDDAKGKGHGTEPHLGTGAHGSTNSVLMIAFEDETPLEHLIELIGSLNARIVRPDDRIRLFQVPLELIV
jgi:hypothetical protein